MLSKIAPALILALPLILAGPAQAAPSASVGVHVINVAPNNAGVLVFYVDAIRTGLPACATSGGQVWTINTNTAAGQVMASALFTALSTGLPVDIGGAGACDVAAGSESAGFIAVRKP